MKSKSILSGMSSLLHSASFVFMTMACCACLTSCGDDDGDGGSTGGSGNLPSTGDMGITDPVVAITSPWGDVARFNYTDGALTSGVSLTDGINFTIGGNPLVIKGSANESDGESYKQTISNIRQNAAGAVTSATLTIEESGYGETYRASGNFTCTYDSGNRLIKMVSESSSPEYSYEAVYTNTWQDGNLIKTVMTYTEKETEEGETYEYNGYEEYNFEYDGVKNNGIYVHFMDDSVPEYILYAGLMGKPSEDMISAYSVKYSKDSQPNSVTCSTDKDSKGRVSAYYENGSLQYSFYYSDTVSQMQQQGSAAKRTHARRMFKTHAEK